MIDKFISQWLVFAKIPSEKIHKKTKEVIERSGRLPWPYRKLYALNVRFIDLFGPFLTLFIPRAAHNLGEEDFALFLKKLKEHPFSWVRLITLFAFAPIIEVLVDEEITATPAVHPLNELNIKVSLPAQKRFDYIIIGTGAGGAPAAFELANKGFKVAIIEKGDILKLDTAPRMLEKYYVGQGFTVSMTGGTLLVLAGSTVGGTTSINSGTCLRPYKDCLQIWDDMLDTNFTQGTLDEYFERVEEEISVCTPPRSVASKATELFESGLKKIGREGAYILPRNTATCVGSGRCCFGCPGGFKQSTDYAYLPKAVKQGAELFYKTNAIEIRELKDKVEVVIENELGRATLESKKLIVSGGALYTPGILKKNRLGSAYAKSGKNLKIHPATKVFAYFPEHFHGELGVPQGLGYRPPELSRITLEGIHTPKSLVGQILSVGGNEFNWWMERVDYLSSFGLMIRDRSSGSLIEKKALPWINYRLHPDDARDIGAGIILIAQAFFAAGAERVLMPFSGNSKKEFSNVEELNTLTPDSFRPKSMIISGFHPQGTAGMGRVVDNDLKLFGSERVFVCDASVLPDSPGVNPQITIMALSLRLAKHLSEGKALKKE